MSLRGRRKERRAPPGVGTSSWARDRRDVLAVVERGPVKRRREHGEQAIAALLDVEAPFEWRRLKGPVDDHHPKSSLSQPGGDPDHGFAAIGPRVSMRVERDDRAHDSNT